MKKSLPTWLSRALFESVLIVLSVVLALTLNEWRAKANESARVSRALDAISAEIAENRRLVTAAMEYHTRLEESFAASAQAQAERPDEDVVTQGVFAPAAVLRTAWDAAQSTGLSTEIPYETVLELSTVYASQDVYVATNRAVGHLIYDQLLSEGLESMILHYENLIPMLHDQAIREQLLAQSYQRVLDHLEHAKPAAEAVPDATKAP